MKLKFASRIVKLRKSAGLSQKEAAALLGVSAAQLSHYENGIRECGLDFILKLSEVYGASCDYILGADKNKRNSSLHIESEALEQMLIAAESEENGEASENLTKAADCFILAAASHLASGEESLKSVVALPCAEIYLSSVKCENPDLCPALSEVLKKAIFAVEEKI